MARAAVKAKQQAKAQAAKPARGRARRRRHSGGGNPNQQLFFMRLRRGQKWLYALLAVVFAVTFAGVGVGSGGGGLSDLYSGLFGGGGSDQVSKAKDEIKKDPAKGYRDLATAYETKGDNAQAVTALQSYLKLRKKDANVWQELGNLELSQARTYAAQFQQAQQAAQLADPTQPFQPGGTLAQAIGTNPAYSAASQQATTLTSTLSQQVAAASSAAIADYKKATKLQPHNATAQEQLATAAETAGDYPTAIKAWKNWVKLSPGDPQRGQIKARIKQLEKALAPAKSSSGSQPSYGKK